MKRYLDISDEIYALGEQAERVVAPYFSRIDRICDRNTEKVLAAFRSHRVSDNLFAGTTGYGYDDAGRDRLDEIYAEIFGTEAALVRIGFVNGTHALCCAMYSAVKQGDVVLSVTGSPYDTLQNTITGDYYGSMKNYGIEYRQVDLRGGLPDLPQIQLMADLPAVKLVFIQRSKGYAVRESLSCEQIRQICETVRSVNPNAVIMVDNCYGEFVEELEPTQVGADLAAGSLIKNPGGGLAPTGGYIVGRADLVENAAYRLTAPGIGGECGCTMGQNRLLYQGLFLAPHTTAQALKTAIFCAKVMELLGFEVSPKAEEVRHDIIQTIAFGAPEPLCRFCEGIQAGAPVDSFVTPEPWAMPGYDDPVIMAAGAFVQGASIELSADAPMREPYVCYMQGGLTYSSGKAGILLAAERIKGLNHPAEKPVRKIL